MGHDGHIQEQKRMPSDVHLDFQTYFWQRLFYLERLRHLSAALAQFRRDWHDTGATGT